MVLFLRFPPSIPPKLCHVGRVLVQLLALRYGRAPLKPHVEVPPCTFAQDMKALLDAPWLLKMEPSAGTRGGWGFGQNGMPRP